MTKQDIFDILSQLNVSHVHKGNFIRIDFFSKEYNLLGYMEFTQNESCGCTKPIKQKYNLVKKADMFKVIDYVNQQKSITEKDYEVVHKSIYEFCIDLINRFSEQTNPQDHD